MSADIANFADSDTLKKMRLFEWKLLFEISKLSLLEIYDLLELTREIWHTIG